MCAFPIESRPVLYGVYFPWRDTENMTGPPVALGIIWQWGKKSRAKWLVWVAKDWVMNRGGLFLSCERRLGSSCSRKVKDLSLTRKFKCVCDQGGWPSSGLNGRLMDRGSEPDGLWGALFAPPPPVIHHISSWYWEIAVPHWWEGDKKSRRNEGQHQLDEDRDTDVTTTCL